MRSFYIWYYILYIILAEVPGVAREIFKIEFLKGYSRVPSKNVSSFGPAVWPAIDNIYVWAKSFINFIDIQQNLGDLKWGGGWGVQGCILNEWVMEKCINVTITLNWNSRILNLSHTGTSDRTLLGLDLVLKCLGFSLYPLSFYITVLLRTKTVLFLS